MHYMYHIPSTTVYTTSFRYVTYMAGSVSFSSRTRNGSQGRDNGGSSTPTGAAAGLDQHVFQEYTYKKITPCDICSQILRGNLVTLAENSTA